jgi:hypothetical protein
MEEIVELACPDATVCAAATALLTVGSQPSAAFATLSAVGEGFFFPKIDPMLEMEFAALETPDSAAAALL